MTEIPGIDRERLVKPEGGSLNDTVFQDDEFVKSYAGSLPRGFEKLIHEYLYLSQLTPEVARRFPQVLAYHFDRNAPLVELRLERIRYPALAKAILRGIVTPDRTGELLAAILHFLTSELYPLRSGELSGKALYARFHGSRMERSLGLLEEVPEVRRVVTANGLIVNGQSCPSPVETLAWMNTHAPGIFQGSHHLVAGHGDAHLDNMMVSTDGPIDFRLIDPRGDALLPPHFDLAKLLKAIRTGYDLIHYKAYTIDIQYAASVPVISVAVDASRMDYYRVGMDALKAALPAFSQAEGISQDAFVRALTVAEIAHVISFASYHAHRPEGCDPNRVTAYLAVAALLQRNLMFGTPDLTAPLPIWKAAA